MIYQFIPLDGTEVIKWEFPDSTVKFMPEMAISFANIMREAEQKPVAYQSTIITRYE